MLFALDNYKGASASKNYEIFCLAGQGEGSMLCLCCEFYLRVEMLTWPLKVPTISCSSCAPGQAFTFPTEELLGALGYGREEKAADIFLISSYNFLQASR